MSDVNDWNAQIINEFRANDGKVGGPFEGAPMILVHHTGRKSGAERVNPLVYQALDGGRFAVFASKAGAPDHPDWYHNLLAHPDTVVEVGTDRVRVHARDAVGDERDAIYARQREAMPTFAEYEQKAAPRTIPVVVLEPAAS
ncbi:MAG TPA: nitroreductase family deazaflavin-dependent oxidoreductase [Acidimicrobiales bacterium]|nr:nitroreductase family deazaflavin-dependent oxidoreductase [Acidimicrobiales bacterium]